MGSQCLAKGNDHKGAQWCAEHGNRNKPYAACSALFNFVETSKWIKTLNNQIQGRRTQPTFEPRHSANFSKSSLASSREVGSLVHRNTVEWTMSGKWAAGSPAVSKYGQPKAQSCVLDICQLLKVIAVRNGCKLTRKGTTCAGLTELI